MPLHSSLGDKSKTPSQNLKKDIVSTKKKAMCGVAVAVVSATKSQGGAGLSWEDCLSPAVECYIELPCCHTWPFFLVEMESLPGVKQFLASAPKVLGLQV